MDDEDHKPWRYKGFTIKWDEDEVEELGKNAPRRSNDSVDLSKDEWDDNHEYWMGYYSNEIDDEVSNIDFTEFDINDKEKAI
jgi:hypothetical protein